MKTILPIGARTNTRTSTCTHTQPNDLFVPLVFRTFANNSFNSFDSIAKGFVHFNVHSNCITHSISSPRFFFLHAVESRNPPLSFLCVVFIVFIFGVAILGDSEFIFIYYIHFFVDVIFHCCCCSYC